VLAEHAPDARTFAEAIGFDAELAKSVYERVKEKLARNRLTKPLFDTDRFRRHIEAAYTAMWEIHQRGEGPRSFAVPPVD
jgi:predicted O-linked N-acetylglucosamine transferase (SPINDLY family)